ncbi:MAG: D-alanine-D-alanine ligase [Candidatus Collierbacteria bacterium GW2011_GWA1_44_12]|uniref:D-alanine-D-alanine ligase n=1 Tax=Candidatus Collierbacteria bacterium GW2011_GWA1_44_12 TaxID=1618376 RepID=A0A0G1JLS6_9BACT|nr:MAG: D-alanine-D-alanine ligase [Candidatus Collierbacteria bacterium GW2011_GWA1_44_12]
MLGLNKKVTEKAEEKKDQAAEIKAEEKQESITPKVVKKAKLRIDRQALKKLGLVVVAYSHVEREWFPTEESYYAEVEVEDRAKEVAERVKGLGVNVKTLPGDPYFLTNLLVDKPDLVLNLVDTLKGKDKLQTSVPAALELSNIPYTGAGMEGLVIGNNRNLTKRLLLAYGIPTPAFQFIRRAKTAVQEDLGLPLIVKLNESGGSVGIDDHAVKETVKDAQKKVNKMVSTYKIPVIVEQFIDGPEVTVVVFDDGSKKHVYMGQKIFRKKPDGKHYFTSFESYDDIRAYTYKHVEEPLASKISQLAIRAFRGLHHKDWAKFDVRVQDDTGIPYFTDSNPNTAFGPDAGLPMTEVLALHGISFDEVLASLLSNYARGQK